MYIVVGHGHFSKWDNTQGCLIRRESSNNPSLFIDAVLELVRASVDVIFCARLVRLLSRSVVLSPKSRD
jgi:hypothetical protein